MNDAWLKDAIPVDPGPHRDDLPYRLGVATVFMARHIDENFANQMANILGRPVAACVFDPRVEAATRRLKQLTEEGQALKEEADDA